MKLLFKKKPIIISLFLIFTIGIISAFIPRIQETMFPETVETSAAKRKLPIYCVDTQGKPQVAISFDAAWGAEDTDTLIEILNKNNVNATFFLCGYWVDKYPDEVKKLYEAGNEIGNHSNTHPHSSQLSLEENKKNIMECHNKIKELLNIDPILYRPPFGEYNDTVITAAEECNYYPIQWDVDSLDWKELGSDHEINQVINHKHLGNGSIILFHNDAKYTPDVLDSIIKQLKDKGFEIVPISELIHKENYIVNSEGRQLLSTTQENTTTAE